MTSTVTQSRIRPRPAHPSGPTLLTYTPNGSKLITAGSNDVIRVYTIGSDGEPKNIDDCQGNNTALVATNGFFVTGSEDGTVCLYSLETYTLEKILTRCTLPIRDLAISKDGEWVAVASDELQIKVVNTTHTTQVLYLRDQPKSPKHVTFHPNGTWIAVSCTNGKFYMYNIASGDPELIKTVDGLIRNLDADSETSSSVIWHPDGRAFATATATRDIQVVSRDDYERQKVFSGGHMGDITSLAWSPNGALLATAGADRKIMLWETKTQKVIARYEYANVINFAWHPYDNAVAFTTSDGEVYIYPSFIDGDAANLLEKTLQPAPFLHDPLSEISGNARKALTNGIKASNGPSKRRRGTPDSLDDILPPDLDIDDDNFVSDDDGAGYREHKVNGIGKRGNDHLDDYGDYRSKRRAPESTWEPSFHDAFQPGSTPWRGERKYLCLNLIGFIWTVDQGSHHTITVEFYDREFHRDFHFTDPFKYDKACLNENGTLFSCPESDGHKSTIFYRPHETWTTRDDWRVELPSGEDVEAIALSDSYVTVTTTANYVRVYTLFGTPVRVYRHKSSPGVTCVSWRDYVLTMGNGPVGGDGQTRLVYTIENIKRDEICQNEDVVALPEDAELKSVMFSDTGDPYIFDSTGVLLVLQHWRNPGQARWVPVLDTTQLDRLAGGKKEETYWPVAVALEKFHCIILKGGDKYPYFPKPLLTEFAFKIPCSAPDTYGPDAAAPEVPRLEESFVRTSLLMSLLEDLASSTTATHVQRSELTRREVEIDKILLQLLNVECRDGEERGMKALEIVSLMKDRSGTMLDAAGKVAGRYGRKVLQEKISGLAEKRLMGLEDEDA